MSPRLAQLITSRDVAETRSAGVVVIAAPNSRVFGRPGAITALVESPPRTLAVLRYLSKRTGKPVMRTRGW
jgi:hypothetical protein